ncbi:MAG: hypothetical protein ACREAW_03035 [Nitrososphaera sp.]
MSSSEDDSKQAFRLIRKRAERTVNENIAAYKQNVAATIEYELIMMRKDERDGNDIAAGRHRVRAEIYRSILERI